MINSSHRAESVPRSIPIRIPAAGTAMPAARRASPAFRPPARPTVVHFPQPSTRWRTPAAIAVLVLCALALVWGLSRQEQRQAVTAEARLAPSATAAAVPPPTPEEEREMLARQIPAPQEPPPVLMASDANRLEKTILRLANGDTLANLLADLDLERAEVARAIAALRPHLDIRRLQVGQPVHVTLETPVATGTPRVLHDLTIRPEARREVMLERGDDGSFEAREKVFEVLKRFHRVAGRIKDSLIVSAQRAGLPHGALADMLHAFAFDVSFQHDLKAGDRFAALVEQARTEDGRLVGAGRLLWARLTTGGGARSFTVYRFKPRGGRDFFYTPNGESVVRALLRTPLDLARLTISSAFGMRRHPLLGFTRLHAGVDFPAPPGTPVLAAGDGRVAQAGRNGGYGNWVKIVHSGSLATGYAHLLRFARGIRPGVTVHQSQVIGFVGSTGLSTGPHLHFELQRNGTPVNPLTVAHRSLRSRLTGSELARFKKVVAEVDRLRSGG
jgi:murein DD-endopeptidase MepM/ murein hydrolase activator NlpD